MSDIIACILMFILFLLVAYIIFSYNNASTAPKSIVGGLDISDDINPALQEYYKKTFPLTDNTVVQLHYADWCGACKTFLPAWNKLMVKYKKHANIQLLKNDQDKNEVPGISTVPAILKYKNGALTKFSGKKDIKAISQWIKS